MTVKVLIDGQVEEFALPSPRDKKALSEVDALCDAIYRECVRLQGDRKKLRTKTKDWFSATAYEVICKAHDYGIVYLFKNRAIRFGRHKRTYAQSENDFTASILGILAEGNAGYDEKSRGELGDQLLFAFRHHVPNPFLQSFIKTSGFINRSRALGEIRAGFEEWIIGREATTRMLNSSRGPYPPELNKRIVEHLPSSIQKTGDLVSTIGKLHNLELRQKARERAVKARPLKML